MTIAPTSGGQYYDLDSYIAFLKKQHDEAQMAAQSSTPPRSPALAGLRQAAGRQ